MKICRTLSALLGAVLCLLRSPKNILSFSYTTNCISGCTNPSTLAANPLYKYLTPSYPNRLATSMDTWEQMLQNWLHTGMFLIPR